MAHHLNLTNEQEAQIYQINLERANQHENAYQKGRKKELIHTSIEQWHIQLKEVLTPKQLKKLSI